MEMKRILWPTDFSDNAESALPYVESLGEKYQTEVHVLYVIPELGDHEPWYGTFDRSHIDRGASSISSTWPLEILLRLSSKWLKKRKLIWWSWQVTAEKGASITAVSPKR